MSARVVVIGAGFAGVAAAWAAARRGADVTVVAGPAGASSLGSGAVDDVPWDERVRAAAVAGVELVAGAVGEDVAAFFGDLGGYRFPTRGEALPRLATTAGIVRVATGHDEAQLDLGRLAGRTVFLPRVARAGWDADSLARCLEASPIEPDGTRFVACDAPVLRFSDEECASDADLAARHDAKDRLAWLARNLGGALDGARDRAAFLVGPWLGLETSRAAELSALVGAPVGEVLSGTAGVAGLRFDARAERLLGSIGARRVTARATHVRSTERRFAITTDGDPARLDGDLIVLAVGGLGAGGLSFRPADARAGALGAAAPQPAFRLSLDVPEARVTDGHDTGTPSTTHGPVLDEVAWPRAGGSSALERPGVLVGSTDGRIGRGIFAAGDVVAGRRRTVLQAVTSGLVAGRAAAQDATTSDSRNEQPLDRP
jgi:hypothetical protein